MSCFFAQDVEAIYNIQEEIRQNIGLNRIETTSAEKDIYQDASLVLFRLLVRLCRKFEENPFRFGGQASFATRLLEKAREEYNAHGAKYRLEILEATPSLPLPVGHFVAPFGGQNSGWSDLPGLASIAQTGGGGGAGVPGSGPSGPSSLTEAMSEFTF